MRPTMLRWEAIVFGEGGVLKALPRGGRTCIAEHNQRRAE